MESSKTTPAILIKFTYVVVLVKLVIFLVHNFLIGALLLGVIGVQSSKFNDFHHFSPLNNSVTVFSYWTKLIISYSPQPDEHFSGTQLSD